MIKLPPTFAIRRLLSHHLAREIPHKQQHIVGLIRHQLIRMADRDALPGHVFTLLIRVGVDHKLEEAFAEIEIVHQRRALSLRRRSRQSAFPWLSPTASRPASELRSALTRSAKSL